MFNFVKVKPSRGFKLAEKKGVILPPSTEPTYYGYKEPLTPVKDGFGYMGVVTGNKERTHIQCHICGYYFSYLGTHLITHKTNAREYKETFGLKMKTSLIGEELRRKRIEAQLNQPKALTERRRRHMRKLGRANRGVRGRQSNKYTLEKKNELGLCPDQIIDRIHKLETKLGRTPRLIDYMGHYKSGASHVIGTYGTWNNAVRIAELPVNRKGQGNKEYSVEKLLSVLNEFNSQHGRYPSYSDVRRGLIPSAWTWSTYFGGLKKAVAIAEKVELK